MGEETDGRSNGPFRPFYYFPLRNNILTLTQGRFFCQNGRAGV